MSTKRDSKDPLPEAANTQRQGGGNEPYPAGAEDHGQKKAAKIPEDSRYTLRTGGESQPTRQKGNGNTPVTGETHDSKKAEKVTEDRRY